MSKFKIGDRVKTHGSEWGFDIEGKTGTAICYPSLWDIGIEFDTPIRDKDGTLGHNASGKGKAGHCLYVNDSQCELLLKCDTKIVITTDGTETLARLYEDGKVVKSATAKCSPKDEFDFSIGARLAFDRLTESTAEKTAEKWRVVHRPARVGDYIRLKKELFSFNKIGDILKVAGIGKTTADVKECDHPRSTNAHSNYLWHYSHNCYEVIESCTAEKKEEYKEPQYYNGKAVCVKCEGSGFTVGKVYEFIDGQTEDNDGIKRPIGRQIKKLEEYNGTLFGFIPFVE
jgi:hypothetical protein